MLTAQRFGTQPLPPAFPFHAKASVFGVEGGAGLVLVGASAAPRPLWGGGQHHPHPRTGG